MADAPLVHSNPNEISGFKLATWSGINTTDRSGAPLEWPMMSDKTFQMTGVVSAGSPSLSLEGSNDGTNWGILTDDQGVAITLTTDDRVPRFIGPNTRFIRPTLSGGDGSTAIGVTISAKGS